MNFLEYVLADILGVVTALIIYDFLVEIKYIKVTKRTWKSLKKQLVGLFKKNKKRKRKQKITSKGNANDVY